MSDETIDTRSLRLAANYVDAVRDLLKDLWRAGVIPSEIENKYKLRKLKSGLIDIQKP